MKKYTLYFDDGSIVEIQAEDISFDTRPDTFFESALIFKNGDKKTAEFDTRNIRGIASEAKERD